MSEGILAVNRFLRCCHGIELIGLHHAVIIIIYYSAAPGKRAADQHARQKGCKKFNSVTVYVTCTSHATQDLLGPKI